MDHPIGRGEELEPIDWDLFRFELSIKVAAVGAACSSQEGVLPRVAGLWFSERGEHIECLLSLLLAYTIDRPHRRCFPKGLVRRTKRARKQWAAACFALGFGPARLLIHADDKSEAKRYLEEWEQAIRHLLVVHNGLHFFTCKNCSAVYVERIVRRLQQDPSERLSVFRP